VIPIDEQEDEGQYRKQISKQNKQVAAGSRRETVAELQE
jgi:hypothetical protein